MTRVAVVGPGRAGTAVALRAVEAGYHVVGVAGRAPDGTGDGRGTLSRFTGLLPGVPVRSAAEAAAAADLVVLSVPDAAVEPVARHLATVDAVREGVRFVHLAGILGTAPLRPLTLAGGRVAATHPAQTLADPVTGQAELEGAMWAVTTGGADRPWARRLVRDLGGRPIDVAEADRVTYHVATTIGANAVSALVTLARDLLLGIGVEEPEAVLAPLAGAAVRGAAEHGAAALTGAVRRGDAVTVARHLDELAVVMPEVREVYRTVSMLALGQARRAGLDAATVQAMAETLARDDE